jgi:DNA repair exonuclease SbcCD ATPase subunit
LASSLLVGSLSVAAFGQAQPGGNGGAGQPGQPGGRGNRGNFDPAQFRQRMMQRIQEQLGATDEEMQALSPKIEKVMQLQRDAGGGRGGFGRRGGGPGGPNAAQDPNASAVQKAVADLRTTLENKDAKPDEIKAKLDAVRQARAQAKQNLTAAQQELKGLLTQRQEAVMVEMGMLE